MITLLSKVSQGESQLYGIGLPDRDSERVIEQRPQVAVGHEVDAQHGRQVGEVNFHKGFTADKMQKQGWAAVVDFGPDERKWFSVRGNAVIPYDAEWSATTAEAGSSLLTIAKTAGQLKSNALADASGWYGWDLSAGEWGYGTFDLLLTFPGYEKEWTATLVRMLDGAILTIR